MHSNDAVMRGSGLSALLCLLLLTGCGGDEPDARVETAGEAGTARARIATSESTKAAEGTETRAVAGDVLPYADVGGKLARGYFAYPADMTEPLPAAILIHDWFGLNEEMRKVAGRIAGQGFIVLAIDMFEGQTAEKPIDAREILRVLLERPEAARDNIRQAFEFLDESIGVPQIAAVGWGAGGLWSLNTALMFPDELDAVVIVQGQFITDQDRLATLNMPLLGIYGAADGDIPPNKVRAFADTLQAAGIANTIKLYPTAGRGFMLEGSAAYNAEQSANAWQEIFAFLRQNLIDDSG